jgi:hypothetical protein
MYAQIYKLQDAATATDATSPKAFYIGDRMHKSIQFVASSVTAGSSGAFSLEVSNDDINWVAYIRLVSNLANSNVQNDTKTAAPTLSSNTNAVYFFPEGDHIAYIRCKITVATDGVYSALLHAL